jgi:hypothetical protein
MIAPNPANDYVAISLNSNEDAEISMLIFDNTGKIILSSKQKVFKGSNSIHLNNLSRFGNGMYVLKTTLNGRIVTKDFIIRN